MQKTRLNIKLYDMIIKHSDLLNYWFYEENMRSILIFIRTEGKVSFFNYCVLTNKDFYKLLIFTFCKLKSFYCKLIITNENSFGIFNSKSII